MKDLWRLVKHISRSRQQTSIAQTLPVDVLYLIYDISADLNPPALGEWDHCERLGCVQLTHVCRHWRDVGLNFPGFWGKIISCIPKAAGALDRARGAPLTFRPGQGSLHLKDDERVKLRLAVQALAYSQVHRIQCLDLSRDHEPRGSEKMTYTWFPLFFHPGFMQSLTTLVLISRVHVPANLLDGSPLCLPSLQRLQYSNPNHFFVAPALKSLTLDMNSHPLYASQPWQPIQFRVFLNVIRHASYLQELRFAADNTPRCSDDFFIDISTPIFIEDIVDIPSLHYIGLSGSPSLCRRLLDYLRIAPSITIHYYAAWVAIEDDLDFASRMTSLLRGMGPQLGWSGHQSLVLGISSHKLDLGLSCRVNLDRVWPAEMYQPHVCISLRFVAGEDLDSTPNQSVARPRYMTMIRSFLDIVNTDNMSALDLTLCRTAHSEILDALRGRMFTSLTDLSIDIASPSHLLVLAQSPSTSPALNSLRVVNVKRVKSKHVWGLLGNNPVLTGSQGRSPANLAQQCSWRVTRRSARVRQPSCSRPAQDPLRAAHDA
ncbi:hypothetical protein PENSPDRAFT_750388 [Peniophora sp. CONT]|nr:hypothetical protein PENSPDRAFT_750388 [Peniophora sp. CONT]